jgi:hypothetical protein
VAEHALTEHKVAIKILNRRKICAMDIEEKATTNCSSAQPSESTHCRVLEAFVISNHLQAKKQAKPAGKEVEETMAIHLKRFFGTSPGVLQKQS